MGIMLYQVFLSEKQVYLMGENLFINGENYQIGI